MSNGSDLSFQDFLRLPLNDSDLIRVVRMFNGKKHELVIYWKDVKTLLGQGVLLKVNGVNNPVQNILNLVNGTNITIVDNNDGSVTINATGGGGGVQSVTGLDTDNTDPANPVIQIAVDGVTITGDGTAGNPLVSVGGGSALEILEDGVSVDANVDEINFKTPLKATQTAAGKVDVEVGIEKRINAAPTYYTNGLVKINVQIYETSETFEERFEYNSDSQITKKETKDDLRGTWVQAVYTWTGNQLNLPTYTDITLTGWSIT
jgi:hypothetical protein